ncbi:MAG: cation diffusion facilitator family transporter [Wenzhouxiangellaceae bacterium]
MSGHHHHSHPSQTYDRAFALGVGLNVVYALVELIAGLWLDSIALIADAGHNMTDVAALLLSWGAYMLASRPATMRRTYGWRRMTILASVVSGALLLLAVVAIAGEAWQRLLAPRQPLSLMMGAVALVGVAVNFGTAYLFHAGSRHDLNLRGAWLHMLADALVSLAVVAAAGVIFWTDWLWFDPLIAIAIALVILSATWGLLRDSIDLASDAVPRHIDSLEVGGFLRSREGVQDLHDLHIWALSTTETALTAHLIMPRPPSSDRFLLDLEQELADRFLIQHMTIQIERGDCEGDDHAHCNEPTALTECKKK